MNIFNEEANLDDSGCAFLPSSRIFDLPNTRIGLLNRRLSDNSREIASSYEGTSSWLNVVLFLKDIHEGWTNGLLTNEQRMLWKNRIDNSADLVKNGNLDEIFKLREEFNEDLFSSSTNIDSSSSFQIANQTGDDIDAKHGEKELDWVDIRREQNEEYNRALIADKKLLQRIEIDDRLKKVIHSLREKCEEICSSASSSTNQIRIRVRIQNQDRHVDFRLLPTTEIDELLLLIKLEILENTLSNLHDMEHFAYKFSGIDVEPTSLPLSFRVCLVYPKVIIAEVLCGKSVEVVGGVDSNNSTKTLGSVGLEKGGTIVVEDCFFGYDDSDEKK